MAYIGATPAYGVFNRQVVTGDGTTTVYTLDYPVSSATQLMIVLDGIVQEPEYSYTVTTSSGTGKLTFSEAPDNNARASIVYMGTFNGTGSQTAFTLTRVPSAGNGANLLVFVEGVYQRYGASYSYTTSGETLTFSAAPNSGTANIQIIQLAESNNTIDTVLDNSITNAKLSLSYSPSHFSGNGSTTAFTITTGHTVNTILVFENGVCLKPTDDYTVSGTTLTMISAPLNGADISVRYLPI